jgi:ribonuclease P protein component
MRLHVAPNELSFNRVVFVTLHSYPGAVQRNRARRLLRECWRLCKASRTGSFDVAVVLYPGYDEFETRKAQLERLLRQAGLLSTAS